MFIHETTMRLKTQSSKGHGFNADSHTNFESSTLNYHVGAHLGQSKYFFYKINLRFWHKHPELNSVVYTEFQNIPNSSTMKEFKHTFNGKGDYIHSSWCETTHRNNRKEIYHPGGDYFIENFTEKRSEFKNELIERMQFIKDLYNENSISSWEQFPLFKAIEAITSGNNKTLQLNMGGNK